jgi:hypothetical protein
MSMALYTTTHYASVDELRQAVERGERISVQPIDDTPINGMVSVEGPPYPARPTWWAEVVVDNNMIVKVNG